jgi:N-acyl-D-aspartate/D-glutamate deacylase
MATKVSFLANTSRIFTAFATVTPWPHGHSALRAYVMGLERSLTVQPTKFELNLMQRIARDAIDAGFIGISIDMFPWHRMSGEWQGCTIPSQHAKFK